MTKTVKKPLFSHRSRQSTQIVKVATNQRKRLDAATDKHKRKRGFRQGPLEDSQYLQPSEIAAFFKAVKSPRDRAIFRVALHRGLRAHEVGLLQLSDFRIADRTLFVRRGKGSISREYELTDIEMTSLRAWLKVRGLHAGPLFPSRQGKGIHRARLDQLMKQYCRAAGLRPEKAHMHAWKHSCGTSLADRNNSPDVIQDWLGHRDSKSSALYTHMTHQRRTEAAERNRTWC
jgi:type 1 fimbriae regulatory protein FimB